MITLLVLLSFLLPKQVRAEEEPTQPLIEDIKLVNSRDDLMTYFSIEHAFSPKINQAIMNGIPTTFTFYVLLYKTGGTFFDKKVADIQVQSTLKYNPLKKEFTVARAWKKEPPVTTQSFEEARELMTRIDNLTILPLTQLERGDKYQLRVKAELEKVTLPLSLHYVLFFVSFWDFETNWYLVNFTY